MSGIELKKLGQNSVKNHDLNQVVNNDSNYVSRGE